MKLRDVLYEGMEFSACELQTREDGTKVYSQPGLRAVEKECPVCEGSGKSRTGGVCAPCQGTGKSTDHECDGPEMQVSNSNGMAIQRDILGVEADYAGSIPTEQLPALRRKLIKMINVDKERESMHKQTTDSQGEMRRTGTNDNVTSIGRGARMVDIGRSDEQVLGYAKRMLDIVDYAMKNDLHVTWA